MQDPLHMDYLYFSVSLMTPTPGLHPYHHSPSGRMRRAVIAALVVLAVAVVIYFGSYELFGRTCWDDPAQTLATCHPGLPDPNQ